MDQYALLPNSSTPQMYKGNAYVIPDRILKQHIYYHLRTRREAVGP
jgi:hypothetical protein